METRISDFVDLNYVLDPNHLKGEGGGGANDNHDDEAQ